MADRIWEPYLTEQDRAHLARQPAVRKGAGRRPALLLVDLYRSVFGDRPEPLLDAIERWPMSCGLAAWEALPNIQRLQARARSLGIPVIHVTGLEGFPGWRDRAPAPPPGPEEIERLRRRFDIVDELAPLPDEVVLRKTGPSAFWGTPILALLRVLGADTIVVAGEATSGCVRASVVDAKTHRFKVLVPEECVFDRHEATHALNLFDMEQKYADVLPLDDVLEYLESVAPAGPAAAPAGPAAAPAGSAAAPSAPDLEPRRR